MQDSKGEDSAHELHLRCDVGKRRFRTRPAQVGPAVTKDLGQQKHGVEVK